MSMRTAVRPLLFLAALLAATVARAEFQLQEATIDGIHAAIKSGELTCRQLVEAYVARAARFRRDLRRLD